MTRLILDVPQAVTLAADEEMSTERDARLLVTGEWPDKKLAVTEADLDSLVSRFSADTVPIKIEHVDSPLDPLGLVKRVWRQGGALMGRLAFPSDLAGFLERRGIAKLSVGLDRDPLQLAEVSLVLKPRVPAATLLSEETSLAGRRQEANTLERLRAELTSLRVDRQIGELKAAGKLAPSGEPLARALLGLHEQARITLSEGAEPQAIRDIFLRFLQTQPPVVSFAELARVPGGRQTLSGGASGAAASETMPEFSEDQKAFLRDMLGVEPAEVAWTMAADAAGKGER